MISEHDSSHVPAAAPATATRVRGIYIEAFCARRCILSRKAVAPAAQKKGISAECLFAHGGIALREKRNCLVEIFFRRAVERAKTRLVVLREMDTVRTGVVIFVPTASVFNRNGAVRLSCMAANYQLRHTGTELHRGRSSRAWCEPSKSRSNTHAVSILRAPTSTLHPQAVTPNSRLVQRAAAQWPTIPTRNLANATAPVAREAKQRFVQLRLSF